MLTRMFDREYDGDQAHRPLFFVKIRHYANDTLIPGVEGRPEALEMACDWMGMYSEFFREEQEHTRRMREFVRLLLPSNYIQPIEVSFTGLLGGQDQGDATGDARENRTR